MLFGAAFLFTAVFASIADAADRSGKEVVDTVCITCHGSGANGAPKIGDSEAWSKRAAQGLTGLTSSALKGIRQMPAHGGHPELTDLEIGRAVTYMVNQSGGHWLAPASAQEMAKERTGEQVVKAQCAQCHQSGKDGAPKIGDQTAWVARLKQGLDYVVRSAIRGHGSMPARGGLANLTDAEMQSAILYMFSPTAAAGATRGATDVGSLSAPVGSNHVTAGTMDVYLGIVSAERLQGFPKESPERTMHGGVPSGPDYYHVNISLLDRTIHKPIGDATVDILVEQPGMTSDSKSLELMAGATASYGQYVRLKRNTSYNITAEVRLPSSAAPIRARFNYRTE
jgi:cytochrome c5